MTRKVRPSHESCGPGEAPGIGDLSDMVNCPEEFLGRLEADPGHHELEELYSLARQFMLDIGITNADHPPTEVVESLESFMRDYDAVMDFLRFDIREARARPPYPSGLPVFRTPKDMVDHFRMRYEEHKALYCRYC